MFCSMPIFATTQSNKAVFMWQTAESSLWQSTVFTAAPSRSVCDVSLRGEICIIITIIIISFLQCPHV